MKPTLIIISAPSGAGKTTLCDMLLQEYPELCYSVSCTTREPRGEEEDGIDYHFLERDNFDRLVAEGAFLEYAYVHGNAYGTLEKPVRQSLQQGLSVVMDIDVAGAKQVRRHLEELTEDDILHKNYLDIFILPPSVEELKRRLRTRGEDSHETIERRLRNAVDEMAEAEDYAYKVNNQDLTESFDKLCAILELHGAVNGPDKAPVPLSKHRGEKI